MAVDYDAPRTRTEDLDPESIEEVKAAQDRAAARSGTGDGGPDETDLDEFVLPGADLSDEVLVLEVQPQRADEFTCLGCFLVRHRSQLVDRERGLCVDCA
jgi:hypothetical protein